MLVIIHKPLYMPMCSSLRSPSLLLADTRAHIQGEVLGEINLVRFIDSLCELELTESNFGKKTMSQAGYMPHMQSSLSKGFEVMYLTSRSRFSFRKQGLKFIGALASRGLDLEACTKWQVDQEC